MSTTLLDYAFGIRGFPYVRTDYQGGRTTLTVRQADRAAAGRILDGWIGRAEASGVGRLGKIARTLAEHRAAGGDEQLDQDMKRQACGFRNREVFKLEILAIHEARYA